MADFLEIPYNESNIRVNYYWLRDHCRCENCYDKSTSQRKFNFMEISLDIRPKSHVVENGKLIVTWSDGHQSSYDLEFLYKYQYHVRLPAYKTSKEILWNQSSIQELNYARVDVGDLLKSDSTVRIVLDSLIKYGVAFIENVPATEKGTETAITRLFPIMKTFFGEMWTFSDTKDHDDFAYTKNFLPAHNDNTYFNDASGLQILHCIQHDGKGGENLAVDGFYVLQQLKSLHPETYDRLCNEYQVPSEYIEPGRHHRYTAPVVKVNSLTGCPEQLRFNINDRAVLDTIPLEKMQQFYKDMHLLGGLIQSKENEWWFKLNPGTVFIFDNWRVLHGRQQYTGKRVMSGSYVLRTEFLSAARVAGVIE
ncbi:trimethyllysine dioxygenase, mitochondrial [Culicoides brevitarsis]|uniref:trimethyllysine dioxygenase, mitochondrial n=1 Tax=Culicoides brevitarsis TaxID=469753 RepID=UPI00307C4337